MAKKANSGSREVISPPYTILVRPDLEQCLSRVGLPSARKAWTYWRKPNRWLLKKVRAKVPAASRRSQASHVCAAQRGEGSGVASVLLATSRSDDTEKPEPNSSQRCTVTGQEATDASKNMGNSD